MSKKINLLCFLFGLALITLIPRLAIAADLAFFDENFGDFAEELQLAKEEGKNNSSPCHFLEH